MDLETTQLANTQDLDAPIELPENALRPGFETYQAQALHDYLSLIPKTSALDFYSDVFPDGSLSDSSTQEKGKYAGRIFRDGEWSQFVKDYLDEIA